MFRVNLKPLFKKVNRPITSAMEGAAGLCVSHSHYEVSVDHLMLKLVELPNGDIQEILRYYEFEVSDFIKAFQKSLSGYKTGNTGKPVFSPLLVDLIQDAWLIASVEYGYHELRSGLLLLALLNNPSRCAAEEHTDLFEKISAEHLQRHFHDAVAGSAETAALSEAGKVSKGDGGETGSGVHSRDPDSALAKFTIDVTAHARAGMLDPVFERDSEIRQVVDILSRRRKNNPIIVGEPGVGKTALVEGLAIRIIENDVPEILRNVDLLSLDMGLLQAGAGMKGEFEARLKSVLTEVKASPKPIVLFIDEAHTLIGAGGQAGGSDAANLLKPALARGELRTIAATTWSEYKKYFERDAALSRRFQVVKCDEPSEDSAITILRGLRDKYEESHKVHITDEAVVAAARLSNRYISGRLLPDKAVDLLDTASARVGISLTTKPVTLDDAERKILTIQREIDALTKDHESGGIKDEERLNQLAADIEKLQATSVEVTERWDKERDLVNSILELRDKLHGKTKNPTPDSEQESDKSESQEKAPEEPLDRDAIKSELREKIDALLEIQGHKPLMFPEVSPSVVAHVIADWTGIPVGSMVRDELKAILNLTGDLMARIKGQDHALEEIGKAIRAAKSGLSNPDTPMGVFLLVGPSGVGKTETALAIADLLFGGERFMTTINMSEFQEKHTVSRLLGSPPGYVGYGEGGVLTEAVRQRPYSVVLLDECEKADLDVMNIFYQCFDKGTLADGEGRTIDFKNTVMFLTSNLATDAIMEASEDNPELTMEELTTHIRPILSRHFKPALLARMTVIPYFPLRPETLGNITRLKLDKFGRQLVAAHKIAFYYSESVVNSIVDRCTEVETGARNIDHIMRSYLVPRISTALLEQLSENLSPNKLNVDVDDSGNFTLNFKHSDAVEEMLEEEDQDEPTLESTIKE